VTLYLDTSALVKLYVSEQGSAAVRAWTSAASLIATARITYAEARAAIAQTRRLGGLTAAELRRAVAELDAGWAGFVRVDVSEALVSRAGRLAEEHGLRGYDAVQLAAALAARPSATDYLFASFDDALNAAASREGLPLAGAVHEVRESASPYRRRARDARPQVAASGRSR
jgi:predicted nucleic acid-binding protein